MDILRFSDFPIPQNQLIVLTSHQSSDLWFNIYLVTMSIIGGLFFAWAFRMLRDEWMGDS